MKNNSETVEYIKQIVEKYGKNFDGEEIDIIRLRRLACQIVCANIKIWMLEHKVKNFKVEIKECSNIGPILKVSFFRELKPFERYDDYRVFFTRDEWLYPKRSHTEPNIRLWLPREWDEPYKPKKANQAIFDEFKQEFTLEKIGLALNYPFIQSDYNDGEWVLTDSNNIT